MFLLTYHLCDTIYTIPILAMDDDDDDNSNNNNAELLFAMEWIGFSEPAH